MNATIARIRRLSADALPAADGPLIDAFLAGDQAAFAALVRRHAGLVFATCRRVLRHQQDAEDAFQATFLVLARRAADVWPREAVGSWLFGVAHRVAMKARAVRSRRAAREQPLQEVVSDERPAPDFDLAEAVHRAVLKLPEVYRAAVVACDLQGLNRKDAAAHLGWTEGTLSGRLARARQLLAARLRRVGLALPAGGLAVFATSECAAATVQTTIDLATGTVATMSAPVAALTEGVVRSMALLKLKTMAAAVFTACALGFGAFAATGTGVGDGAGGQQSQVQGNAPTPPAAKPSVPPAAPGARPEAPAPKEPRIDLAREELEALILEIQFMVAAGKITPQVLDQFRARQGKIDKLLAPTLDPQHFAKDQLERDRLQGIWHVLSITEKGKTISTDPAKWVVEVAGRTIRMPCQEPDGGWKQREYVFTLDEAAVSRNINLHAPVSQVGRGIYEFTAPATTCVKCHDAGDRFKVPGQEALGLCAPAYKSVADGKQFALGLRLALSIDGKRPETFGGPGVIVFEMKRPADVEQEQEKRKEDLLKYRRLLAERVAAAVNAREKEKLEAELKALQQQLDELIAREAQRKAKTLPPTPAVLEAQRQVRGLEGSVEAARAALAKAQRDLEFMELNLAMARQQVKEAEKAAADALARPAPAKEGEVFTVHVRTLTAAEKVIRVKATGKETVLEALVYAADDVPIKSDGVSVWVVRDKAVLPVDLPGITKNGETGTNYVLKPGDQLFVQAKPGK